jgi:hypothetical protein
LRVLRPILSSAIITGKPTKKQQTRYIIRNAAPPFEATSVGKRHIFPSPTADPAAASIKPNFEFQAPRVVESIADNISPFSNNGFGYNRENVTHPHLMLIQIRKNMLTIS